MSGQTVAWVAFGVYLVVTTGLALRGMARSKKGSMSSFAIGDGDMGPLLVGVTLAASIASTATFVINPGFVWKDGISALLHFGVAGTLGVLVGLVALSRGFRRLGEEHRALTLPHWVGSRYASPKMRMYFALLNLVLAVCFVVLIVKGSALVMQATLGLSYVVCVVCVVGFVFSYIMLGGTYAHAYTNALQGSIMVVVALLLFGSGLHLFADGGVAGFFDALSAQDPALAQPLNPNSVLFDSPFEVFLCGFVVSFGLVCQPHILMKSLYLRSERDLNRYLFIASAVGIVFALVLCVGLYARVAYPDLDVSQDAIVPHYMARAFSPTVGALLSVALLAAGMSTMDGILVSASTIAGNDLVLGLVGDRVTDPEARQRLALRASRGLLVAMGLVASVLALDPPQLVGIFAQVGIYGLVAASVAPVTFGIFSTHATRPWAFTAAVLGPLVHFVLYLGVGIANPAVSATAGVAVSVLVMGVGVAVVRSRPARP